MDNQHRHIKGYRELSAADIALMNDIKTKARELLTLHEIVASQLAERHEYLRNHYAMLQAEIADRGMLLSTDNVPEMERELDQIAAELLRFNKAEPKRWASIGKTNIQQGVMALVRAVAQPEGDC